MEIFWKMFIVIGTGWPVILVVGFILFLVVACLWESITGHSGGSNSYPSGDSGGDYSGDGGGRDD